MNADHGAADNHNTMSTVCGAVAVGNFISVCVALEEDPCCSIAIDPAAFDTVNPALLEVEAIQTRICGAKPTCMAP
jgi:hypothetical protein